MLAATCRGVPFQDALDAIIEQVGLTLRAVNDYKASRLRLKMLEREWKAKSKTAA